MTKSMKIILAIVLVAVIAVGAVVMSGNKDKTTSSDTTDKATGNSQAAAVTITYDNNGFTPGEATVSVGDKITIVNSTDAKIEPSSDPHPVHTDNPELNFGDIEPGESKTVTLTTPGTWGYHNHYKQTDRAQITVE